MDHLIFIYISPSKQQRNIVQLCTSESHNNLQQTSGRFMESSLKTSLPSYLLQKARYDKDTHFGALCLGSAPRQRVKESDTKLHWSSPSFEIIARKTHVKYVLNEVATNAQKTQQTGTHQCQWYALCLLFTCTALCTVHCALHNVLFVVF